MAEENKVAVAGGSAAVRVSSCSAPPDRAVASTWTTTTVPPYAMPSSVPKDGRNASLYAPLRRRMVENGDWDRISSRLARELNESGWIDRFRDLSKETARRAEATGGISVETLMTELWPQAQDEVPTAARQEIIGVIRKLLERQIEF